MTIEMKMLNMILLEFNWMKNIDDVEELKLN